MRRVFLLLLATAAVWAEPPLLQTRIDQLLSSPSTPRAQWGVQVVDLRTGQTVYERNASQFFIPASNTKLFSTALALSRLGADYRFRTRVVSDGPVSPDGTLATNLRLVGGGDPTLSGRPYPYRKPQAALEPLPDPLLGIEELADQIVARGVRRIRGGIVGDDSAYPWEPYPLGWAADDGFYEYGAPVSALTINDNAVRLSLLPGEAVDEPARIELLPSVEYFTVLNRVRTVASGEKSVTLDREAGSRELRATGRLLLHGSGSRQLLALDDPALFAAQALHGALARRGVAIEQPPAAHHRQSGQALISGPTPVELASRVSPPLSQVVQVINKVSQNLHAELILREVGRVRTAEGSRRAGLREMEAFLKELGLPPQEYRLEDGSGLSRLTLLTPAGLCRLLVFMDRSPVRESWLASLPVGGEDGTLEDRFDKVPAARRIVAKTGTLSHVNALSGYAERTDRSRYAFSVIANNHRASSSEVRAVIDKIALALLE